MKSVIERTWSPGTSQCDINGTGKLSFILEIMQNTAYEHCRVLHVGHDELSGKGLTWVLFRTDIQIARYPRPGERLTVQSFTKGSRIRFFPRYYTVTDESGERICCAGSLWMLMEKASRKSVSSRESGIVLPDADMEAPLRISTLTETVEGEARDSTYTPVYTDFDCNGHVNNIRYTDWLCNELGLSVMKRKEVVSLSIDYRSEIVPGTAIVNSLVLKDDAFRFSGGVQGKQFFCMTGKLRDR